MRIEQTDIYECGHSLYFLIDEDVTPSSSSFSVETQSILNPVPGHCGCYIPDFCPDCDTPQPAPLSSALPPHIIRHVGVRHERDNERVVTEEIEPDDVRFPEDLRPMDEGLRVKDAKSTRSYENWLADISAHSPSTNRVYRAPSRTMSMDDLSDSGEVRFHAAPRTLDQQLNRFTLSDKKLNTRKAEKGNGMGKAPAENIDVDAFKSYASSAVPPRTTKKNTHGNACKMIHSSYPLPIHPNPTMSPAQDIRQELALLSYYIKYISSLAASSASLKNRSNRLNKQYDTVAKTIVQAAKDNDLSIEDLRGLPDLDTHTRSAFTELNILDEIRELEDADGVEKYLQLLRDKKGYMEELLEALLADEKQAKADGQGDEQGSSRGQQKVDREMKNDQVPHLRGGAHWADGRLAPSPIPFMRAENLYSLDLESRYGSEASYHSPDNLDDYDTQRRATREQSRPSMFSRLRDSLRSPRQLCMGKGKGKERAQSFDQNYRSPFAESVADSYDYDGDHSRQGSFIWVPYSSRGLDGLPSPYTSSRHPRPSTRVARSPPPYSSMKRTFSTDSRPPPDYSQRRTSSTDTRPPASYSPEGNSSILWGSRPHSPSELTATSTPPRKSYKGKGKARQTSIDMDCSPSCACSPTSPCPLARANMREPRHRHIPRSPTPSSSSQDEKKEQRWAKLKNVAILRILPHIPQALQDIITELDMIERRSCFIHYILDQGEERTNQQHQVLSTKMDGARLKFDAAVRDHEDFDFLHISQAELRQDLSQDAQDAGLEFEICNRMVQDMDNVPPEPHARRELEVLERWKDELLDELAAVMGERAEKKLRGRWR